MGNKESVNFGHMQLIVTGSYLLFEKLLHGFFFS